MAQLSARCAEAVRSQNTITKKLKFYFRLKGGIIFTTFALPHL